MIRLFLCRKRQRHRIKPRLQCLFCDFDGFTAQCFQFELPGGKILMTDPFFPQNPKAWKEVCTPAFDADELGKVDYVTINHSHFDHTANLPDLFKQARPTVICDRIFARELSAAFQVPEACIRPIVPGLTYHFDDFTLNTFSGNHTDLGTVSNFDGGKMFADPENPMIGAAELVWLLV